MPLFDIGLGAVLAAGGLYSLNRFREHEKHAHGVGDILNWGWLIEPGVVMNKDGALMAGFRYRGPDLNASIAQELQVLTQQVNDALNTLGDNWMIHIDATRRPSTAYLDGLGEQADFQDGVPALIDLERRRLVEGFGQAAAPATAPATGRETGRAAAPGTGRAAGRQTFETEHTLFLTFLPPPQVYDRLAKVFVQGKAELASTAYRQAVDGFKQAILEFTHRLASSLRFEPLTDDELCTRLHSALTGLYHPVKAPADGSYLMYRLSDRDLIGGWHPRIGDQHIRVVALMDYPLESEPAIMDFLNTAAFGYRWSTRLLMLDPPTSEKFILKQQQTWLRKRTGFRSLIGQATSKKEVSASQQQIDEAFQDASANELFHDAKAARALNNGGKARFALHTSCIVLMDEDAQQADQDAASLVSALNNTGFTARMETVNALEAYLGSLAGHGYPNLRKPMVSTLNIADMMPLTSVWGGHRTNPNPLFQSPAYPDGVPSLMQVKTAGSTPFRFNLHDGDVGHTLVVGSTGGGKSTLMALVIAQWQRYHGAQTFVFDVGYTHALLAKACPSARHYDIAAGRADVLRFQPLARIDRPMERAWAVDWVATLLSMQGMKITPVHRQKIEKALNLIGTNDRRDRTLTALSMQMQDEDLVRALSPYTVFGNYGHLLDGDTDAIESGGYQVFEMKHLMDMDDAVLVPTLLYLLHRIEGMLSAGKPSVIILEEVWAPLSKSMFRDRMKQWLLTLRKQNASVILVAHTPAQLDELGSFRQIILDSCPSKIYLPNPEALSESGAAVYARVGLNATEIHMIGMAEKKRHYYYTSPSGSRLFELALGPVELSFMVPPKGLTMDRALTLADAMKQAHGPLWAEAWLDHFGLPDEARTLRQINQRLGDSAAEVDAGTDAEHAPLSVNLVAV